MSKASEYVDSLKQVEQALADVKRNGPKSFKCGQFFMHVTTEGLARLVMQGTHGDLAGEFTQEKILEIRDWITENFDEPEDVRWSLKVLPLQQIDHEGEKS